MTHPKVVIIILNWNGKEDTIECLESLKHITYPNYEILLLDNGSTDGSVEHFKEKYPGIEIIENGENLGFAEGNNVGIKKAIKKGVEYILLLNNDTVVDPKFLDELVKVAEADEKIGAVQPAIYYYDNPREIHSIGGKLNLLIGSERNITVAPRGIIKCDRLIGACMLIKRGAIENIGLLDDKYFLYMEETDWCYRAKKKYSLVGCSNSKIWHKIYSSSGGKVNNALVYYWTRNIILFYKKHHKYYLPVFLIFFSFRLIIQLINNTLIGHKSTYRGTVYGFIDGIKGVKGVQKRFT